MAYKFLSGSSIDNISNFLFDAFESGQCYLGFSKGLPENQWGVNTLIAVEALDFTNLVAGTEITDTGSTEKFFDLNSSSVTGYDETKLGIEIYEDLTKIDNFDQLELLYLGKHWAVVKGLPNDYRDFMSNENANYYIRSKLYPSNGDLKLKILKKSFISVPTLTETCNLAISTNGGTSFTAVSGCTNIEKYSNLFGETFVTGVNNTNSLDSYTKEQLSDPDYIFRLVMGNGQILVDNMRYKDVNSGSTVLYNEVNTYGVMEKYYEFEYDSYDSSKQEIKLIVGPRSFNELAIWQEELPFNSVVPVADSNPPSLDVSYLRNPMIHQSIFDVNGMVRIDGNPVTGDIKYVKEMLNTSMSASYSGYGFDIETFTVSGEVIEHSGRSNSIVVGQKIVPLYPFHTFVVGDKIIKNATTHTVTAVDYSTNNSYIGLDISISVDMNEQLISEATRVKSIMTLAITDDKDLATKYGCYNIMVTKDVDLRGVNSPTEEIYRQLFICYKPKDKTGTQCTADIYNSDSVEQIFNTTLWKYDLGILFYIANKPAIYRKYASGSTETFQIII